MLEDRIYQDYVAALKAKDKDKSQFLSFLRSELKNRAIELKEKNLKDSDVIAVLKKQKKRLQDSKESAVSSGRQELIDNANAEIALIENYLPKPLSEEELASLVDEVIKDTQASSMKDMSRVMKEVLAKSEGRADSRKTSELVKMRLS
ncbi:MAG: GatB/YqeY domain-containing protein [Candidatus Omnitrophica bacterium]|nr:GatB/YqeY domain-containing protein [Candidatus Omnitrophota bacterium]MBD3268843.1 GatB/YqeY domain-containing protein [Candidatus Omnitrophota bacterium]